MQCIRRSLKSTASSVLLNLDVSVKAKDVVDKFEVVFGNILPSEMVLEEFYTARQKESESVVAWGCRVESVLKKAKEQGTIYDTEDMARTKFWSGLGEDKVKTGLRHMFDSGSSFQDLFRKARQLEHEFQVKSVKVKVQSVETTKLDKIMGRLDSLEKQMSLLAKPSKQTSVASTASAANNLFCKYCKKSNHVIEDCRVLARKNAKAQENCEQSTPGAGI